MKQTYGIQAVNEILDYLLIGGNVDWRLYAIKHGIIKQSTKTLRKGGYVNYNKSTFVNFFNGRNQQVFSLNYNDAQLAEFRNN